MSTAAAIRSAAWKLGWAARGWAIERALYGDKLLTPAFPTIDVHTLDKTIISIKSLDLEAASYADTGRLEARINRYVDSLAAFNGATWGSSRVRPDQIGSRLLDLVIPVDSGTEDQMAAIDRSVLRAARLGIKLKLTRY